MGAVKTAGSGSEEEASVKTLSSTLVEFWVSTDLQRCCGRLQSDVRPLLSIFAILKSLEDDNQ